GAGTPTTIPRLHTPRGTTNRRPLLAAPGGSRAVAAARAVAITGRRAARDRMRGALAGRDHTDHLLLRWCQQSAPDEGIVATREPLRIEAPLAEELTELARSLDRLLRRFTDAVLEGDDAAAGFTLPMFPLAKEFLGAGPLRAPYFWARFDVFERADGG